MFGSDAKGNTVFMYDTISQLTIVAAEVKEFFIRDIKGDMSESDLGHGGGEGRCYYFMSFEDVGSHCDNSGDVCAVLKHKFSCIVAAS